MNKKITKQEGDKKPIAPTLRNMEIYDKEVFPIAKMKSVRATASDMAITHGLIFRTKLLREQGLIQVTKIA